MSGRALCLSLLNRKKVGSTMAVLKFRVSYAEDDAVYRDIIILHNQNFFDLHQAILKAFSFDSKHEATFYRSNDKWKRGRELSLEVYPKDYVVPPLLMSETLLASEIRDMNQKFVYVYDFTKNWTFFIELIQVEKTAAKNLEYPFISRKEGIGPQQYGTMSLLGNKFADIEEKFDIGETSPETSSVSAQDENLSEEDDTEDDDLTDGSSLEDENIGGLTEE